MFNIDDEDLENKRNEKYKQSIQGLLTVKDNNKLNSLVEDYAKIYGKDVDLIWDDFYTFLEEEVIKKVSEVYSPNNTKNAIKQTSQIKKLINWLAGYLDGDKKKAEEQINKYSAKLDKPVIYTLEELGQLRGNKKTEYLVSEILPKGVLLFLCGQSKRGKTTFATHLLISYTTGKSFLGRKIKTYINENGVEEVGGNVLFIQNEEPIETITYERLIDGLVELEIDNPELYNKIIRTKRLSIAKGLDIFYDMQKIFDLAEENKCDIIFVDSFGKSIAKGGYTEYTQESMPLLYRFSEEAHKRKISVIVIHHLTKMVAQKGDREGQLNQIGGGSWLLRVPDGFIMVTGVKDKHDEVEVSFILRWTNEFNVQLKRTEGEANYWTYEVLKESKLSESEKELQINILRALYLKYNVWKENKEVENYKNVLGLDINEIISITGATYNDCIKRVNYLLKHGDIEKYVENKKRIYYLSEEGVNRIDIIAGEEDEKIKLLELDTKLIEFLMKCDSWAKVNEITKDYTKETQQRIWNRLTNEQKNYLNKLKIPPKYKEGDVIKTKDGELTIQELKLVKEDGKNIWLYIVNKENNVYYKEEDIYE